MRFGSASDEAEAAGHNGDICPRPTTTHGADPDAKIGRFLLFVGIRRGDNAQKPFRLLKRFFLSILFLSKKRKSIGPAQRLRPFGKKEIQRREHAFSFSHSFFFLQKKEWEKKEKRHPRSLRFISQRRLRRNLRRLALQRRLPGRCPAAGGPRPAPTNKIRRRIRNVGEQLAAPAFMDPTATGRRGATR